MKRQQPLVQSVEDLTDAGYVVLTADQAAEITRVMIEAGLTGEYIDWLKQRGAAA